ncbi:MAG TPA: hypothetical protein VF244_11110 [Acidimicrobiales bacterium]
MSETAAPPRPRRRARVGRIAAGAAVVVALVVSGASPAGADPERSMSIDPTDDVAAPPVAAGSFTGASLLGLSVEQIVAIDLKVSPTGPTGGSPVTQDGCQVVTDGGCRGPRVTWLWEIPDLAYNGPYVVEAVGKYCDPLSLGCGNPALAPNEPIPFRLAAEPQAPADLKLEAGDDRSVIVSWARNPEPDIRYYALFRKDPGGDFRRLGSDIKQPASGRATFTDTSAAGTGGSFVYKVFAVRNGASGDNKTDKISKASAERTTTVAPPPTTTNPGDPGAPVTTIAGEGVDIGSFLSGQAPTLPSPGPIFLDLPDTGFGETLPFGALPDEAEPGEEDAVLPPTPRQRQVAEFKANRPLIPVAAGLVLLVLAGHIRLLNVRTKAAPEKPAPGTYVARALEAARANQIPIDVAAAVANGGHHRAPPPDDVAALPVWAEFEPVAALGLLDAPEPSSSPPDDPLGGLLAQPGHYELALFAAELDAVAKPPAAKRDPKRAAKRAPKVADPPTPTPALAPAPTPKPKAAKPKPAAQQKLAKAVPAPVVEPEPFFPPEPELVLEPEPEPDPALLYNFDDESEWSAAPEVFVAPRR